ncbi:Cupin 2 conserved barrel domain protein [Nitrosococcus halophilus Nc 4]|uniref:Cupin 2 conserved barrel domain protein n=1 Tax=Nitrosococcus halophilus (strain Nc4) TaxID=472759 RepID=D5BVZ8_NITHN|nr:cupin domain-containing protein [Nitrosococcus halophilus]ADE15577.1 Cupin 2 conserved barrel domain protein [Nitrosococcus halophilus Nc 4]
MFTPTRLSFYFTGAFFLLSSFCSLAIAAQDQDKPSPKPLLERTVTLPSKAVKVVVKHMRFPVGFKTPEHTHEGPGPRYIIKGTVKIMEGGKTHTYQAGEVFWESGLPMTAENVGTGEAEVVVFELAPVEIK